MTTDIRETVKEHYGQTVSGAKTCCGSPATQAADEHARRIGYSDEAIQLAPGGSNLGLGCGNPLALGEIHPGDTVLDLGSGAGFDVFLAARELGPGGHAIGVDMTPEMTAQANENKKKFDYDNVEFRQGYLEDLPVDSDSVDRIISNCVINLSADKPKVFREAFRVLKPGGVLAVSDIVLLRKLPWFIRRNIKAYVGCVAGAALEKDYLQHIQSAGFLDIEVVDRIPVGNMLSATNPIVQKMIKNLPIPQGFIRRLSDAYAASIKVRATKPVIV